MAMTELRVVAHDGIEDGEELVHGCDESDFEWFTGFPEAFLEGVEVGHLGLEGAQGCHVEDIAD